MLDIETSAQVRRDPLVGQLFENLVVLEALKARLNRALKPNLYFFRDSHGNEVDLLHKSGAELTGIEIKSAATWHASFKKGLAHFTNHATPLTRHFVVYSGDPMSFSDGVVALPYTKMADIFTTHSWAHTSGVRCDRQ